MPDTDSARDAAIRQVRDEWLDDALQQVIGGGLLVAGIACLTEAFWHGWRWWSAVPAVAEALYALYGLATFAAILLGLITFDAEPAEPEPEPDREVP